MTKHLPIQLAAIALLLLLGCRVDAQSEKESQAQNRTAVAILRVGKPASRIGSESRLEFYSPRKQMLCALDYSSEDGQHGFGVVKWAWTPDNQYFVFSVASSGGHQPWHTPTFFYSIGDQSVRSLDSYVQAAGISKGDFSLQAPNIVLTEAWQGGKTAPVKIQLDSLPRTDSTSENVLRCADGKTIKGDGDSPQRAQSTEKKGQ